jgi:hypothetical protein
MSISSQELAGVFERNGMVTNWLPLDEFYSLPTAAYINGEFADAFRRELQAAHLQRYQPGVWDCDDFSREAWNFAQRCHANTPHGLSTGLAFGMCIYSRDVGGSHAINIYLVKSGEKYIIRFWEPQQAADLRLSQKEIQSIYRIIL